MGLNKAMALMALVIPACCPVPAKPVPVVVEVERIVVQQIPAELLGEQPVMTGPLSECPWVAGQRKEAVHRCNAQLRAIRSMGAKHE